jgi:hypothetical protein
MAVTVEIKTGSRTVISYLLSPLMRYQIGKPTRTLRFACGAGSACQEAPSGNRREKVAKKIAKK